MSGHPAAWCLRIRVDQPHFVAQRLSGVGKCPNVSHHRTIGDLISNRHGKVMFKIPQKGTQMPSPVYPERWFYPTYHDSTVVTWSLCVVFRWSHSSWTLNSPSSMDPNWFIQKDDLIADFVPYWTTQSITHDGSLCMPWSWFAISHQYTPVMLTYIPWILGVILIILLNPWFLGEIPMGFDFFLPLLHGASSKICAISQRFSQSKKATVSRHVFTRWISEINHDKSSVVCWFQHVPTCYNPSSIHFQHVATPVSSISIRFSFHLFRHDGLTPHQGADGRRISNTLNEKLLALQEMYGRWPWNIVATQRGR